MNNIKELNVIWSPHDGSQVLAMTCPCDEILLHGTRGGGKTECQAMRFRSQVGLGYGAFWRGIIFDIEYKNLDDIKAKTLKTFSQFNDGARLLMSAKDFKWIWPTGEELLFRTGSTEDDYLSYHGHEYPFIGFNELTKQSSIKFYELMKTCNRTSFVPSLHSPDKNNPLPDIPKVIFSTTNPHGVGHNWVKNYFIDAGAPGEVVKKDIQIYSAKTKKTELVRLTKTHIWSSWIENEKMDDTYAAKLTTETDTNKKKAYFEGDWSITSGGALDDIWSTPHIRRPRFKIPAQWKIDRSFDWGSTTPFAVTWFAETDGSETEMPDGRWWGPPKGSLVMFADWLGSTDFISNVGLKLSARNVAIGIAARESKMRKDGWIIGDVKPGPADNQINNENDTETDSIAKLMAKEPYRIRWTNSDKSPGSRINGLELMRNRILSSINGDGPGIYIMDNCQASLNTLPFLQRDPLQPDDVWKVGVDHIWDALRYRILAHRNNYAGTLNTNWYGT